jgi:hypothetical protein
MAYAVGNARLKASAIDILKDYEAWEPFEIINAVSADTGSRAPLFYRLRHIAILELGFTVITGATNPEYVYFRMPAIIVPQLMNRKQVFPVTINRYGRDIPDELWVCSGTAEIDPSQGGEAAHYIKVECSSGFLTDRKYTISGSLALELS